MRRASRLLAPLLFAALALPLAGCRVAPVELRIPDFESAQVEGLTFWREVEGQFVVDGFVFFEEVVVRDGKEFVDYRVESPGGEVVARSSTPLVRDGVDPDDVEVELHYPRDGSAAALFKVSSFNAAGDSPLSEESRVI